MIATRFAPSDIAIEIDAGQAFGTGHHGTTAGCLEMIETVMRSRRVRNALDLGTGSGVLAIAVRKLKNIPVLATDIDPDRRSGRPRKCPPQRHRLGHQRSRPLRDFIRLPFRRHGPFDLDHRQYSGAAADPHGAAACRRIWRRAARSSCRASLPSQRWKVLAAYNGAQLRHVRTIWRNGWVTIHLDRP